MNKKSLVYVGVLCVLVSPGFAFAINSQSSATSVSNTSTSVSNYSEEELVALIAKLQKQLEIVRQNKVQCLLADIDLSIGDGEDDMTREGVKNLQNFLKEKGYFKNNMTGYFGKLTKTSLINFQRDNGLEQTGELNASVRSTIKNLKCKKDFLTRKLESKTEKETVKNSGTVTSIALSSNGNTAQWSVVGYAKNGFKIVWSKNPNPTYPTRDGDKYTYLSDPGASSTALDAFGGSGTYYVRVCEYLGGPCGLYSNEVSVSL